MRKSVQCAEARRGLTMMHWYREKGETSMKAIEIETARMDKRGRKKESMDGYVNYWVYYGVSIIYEMNEMKREEKRERLGLDTTTRSDNGPAAGWYTCMHVQVVLRRGLIVGGGEGADKRAHRWWEGKSRIDTAVKLEADRMADGGVLDLGWIEDEGNGDECLFGSWQKCKRKMSI